MQPITPDMIAPCGMDCALCYAYQRADKPCPGCNGADERKPKHCLKCKILLCETRKAGGSCTNCTIFPCRRMREIDGRYRKYGMSLVENLTFVRNHGVAAFVEMEEQRTACPNCGERICVHEKACKHCGSAYRR